jgi:hypothetical protein
MSNISGQEAVDREYQWQPINMFLAVADEQFGPMTTVCTSTPPDIHIPWVQIGEEGWRYLDEMHHILEVRYLAFHF